MAQTSDSGYKGTLTPEKFFGDYNQLLYVIRQVVNKICTLTLVKVISVTNNGTDAAVGFVDVQPLVNQLDATGKSVPYPVLNNLPYMRLQGGTNAIILDPQVGDVGLAAFAQRDISNVKSTKAQANPGSDRRFDMSDGLYLGGFLNGVPTQYVQFQDTGITIHSPNKVTIDAPDVVATCTTAEVTASTSATITAPTTTVNGNAQVNGTVQTTGDVTISGKSFLNHTHPDPQGGNTGTPN